MRWDNALAMRVALATGLRIGDVLALTPCSLSADGAINTICAKTGKPFHGQIAAGLAAALFRNAGELWLFPSPRNPKEHKTRQAVWSDLKKTAHKCGVHLNITPHTARKVYAVETFRQKGIGAVQERLGHDRVSTSMIYAFADMLTGKSPEQEDTGARRAGRAAAFAEALIVELGGREHLFVCIEKAMKKAEVS